VQECVRRSLEAGLRWPLPDDLDEAALQVRLYQRQVPLSARPQPDFAQLHAELTRPGVTRMLLWMEYKTVHPDGWQYSVFSATAPALLYLLHPCSRANAIAAG
jgi:transposase